MKIEMSCGDLALKQHGIALLRRARGVRLVAIHGTAWLTIDGERRDVVLNAGDAFAIETDADVVITALAGPVDLALRADTQPSAGERLWARVRGAFALPRRVAAGAVS